MEHVFSSRNDECHFTNTKNNDMNSSTHNEDELPLFLDFPSPFFDDITTIPMLENNYHTTPRQHPLSSSPSKPALNTTADQSSSPTTEMKQRTKKRSVGKKDRHSKINTAQGLRDRRMRLSLDIARKFFDLQDLLGFDKASKTIEWLFCKSNKAIKEVADNYFIINPKPTNHQSKSICEEIERMADSILTEGHETNTTKLDSTKEEEELKNRESYSRKQNIIQNNNNNLSVKETRDLARARARDRTRERLMIKEQLENKSKQYLFSWGEYPNNNNEIYRYGLRCLASPNNNHNVEDQLGYTSSSSKPSSLSFEQHSSSTHQYLFQDQLQSATTNVVNNYYSSAGTAGSSTLINNNDRPAAAGCLNYYSRFSGMAPTGDWEEDAGGTNYFMTSDEQNPSYSSFLDLVQH